MSLQDAERTDRELREQLNDLVRARARAQREAERLGIRAGLPGAEAALGELGTDYRGQAERLGTEVEQVRSSLRRHEAELERLRAAQAPPAASAAGGAGTPGSGGTATPAPGGGAAAPGTPDSAGPGANPGA